MTQTLTEVTSSHFHVVLLALALSFFTYETKTTRAKISWVRVLGTFSSEKMRTGIEHTRVYYSWWNDEYVPRRLNVCQFAKNVRYMHK